MSAKTVDAPMSENCVLKLSVSSPGCMLGSGIVDVNPSDAVPQGASLDPGPRVNPPQAVSARCADPILSDAPCDLSLLRSASSVNSLLVDESAGACELQPSDGPMGQRSGCNMGQTVSAQGDNYNPDCGLTQRGDPLLSTKGSDGFGRWI